MAQRASLNSYLSKYQVLPLLGVACQAGTLPMRVSCPLCRNPQLRIYDDSTFGGSWHYCPGCKSSGGLLELASRVWKCDLPKTLTKLRAEGVQLPDAALQPESMASYQSWSVDVQEKCRNLMRNAADNVAVGRITMTRIMQQIGMPIDSQTGRWRRRMGTFIGGAVKKEILESLYTSSRAGQCTGTAIFKGQGWKEIMIIPFKDLPDRTMGLLFIGKNAKRNSDYAFKVFDGPSSARGIADIGVCMYETMDNQIAHFDQFGNTTFVINDPAHALRLQARHMRDSELPLPIVGTYNAMVKRRARMWELRAYDVWSTRPDKNFIFWGAVPTADLFNMASRAAGRVAITDFPLFVGRKPSHVWLQLIRKQAVPWMVALEKVVRTMSAEVAPQFLDQLTIFPDLMQKFQAGCTPDTRELIAKYKGRVRLLSTATVRGFNVVESDNGWYRADGKQECISDAILRIDKIVCRKDDDEADPLCQGRILYGEQAVEFCEPMSKLEKQLAMWMRRKVLSTLGKLIVVKGSWGPHLLDVARQFHTPEVVQEDGRFGWKPSESCFALPRFAIHLGGNVSEEPAHVIDEKSPGRSLPAPGDMPVEVSMLLRDTPANQIFWAVTACIGANVIASPLGHDHTGIGLIGGGAVSVGADTSRLHGCYEMRHAGVTAKYADRIRREFDRLMQQHDWPVLFMVMHNKGGRRILDTWLNGDFIKNAVTMLDDWRADLAAMLDPWRIIRCDLPITIGPGAATAGPHIIPCWLHRLSRQRLELKADRRSVIHRVLDDMADMMQPYGDPHAIEAAAGVIEDAIDENAARFVDILFKMLTDGSICFEADGFKAKRTSPAIVRVAPEDRAPGIFIARNLLSEQLLRRNIKLPDMGKVTSILQDAGALDCECSYNDDIGWLLVESWWNRQIVRCRSQHQRRFTVIGGA